MLDRHLERAFSLAVGEAHRRGHEYFTLEHLLYGILSEDSGRMILGGVGVNIPALRRDLEVFLKEHVSSASLEAEGEIVQTLALQRVMQRTLRHMHSAGKESAGIGDVLASLLDEENSYAAYFLLSQGITRLDVLEFLSEKDASSDASPATDGENAVAAARALQSFTVDLTLKAGQGGIDPLIGRTREVERALQILARRRKNNPLFVGDPGVGKTALVEGLAARIAQGDVPDGFAKAKIFALDLGGMMAGTKYRGDFEGRFKSVLAALRRIPQAILFVDEIHTLVGAGAVSGSSLDASNLLKPALASGGIRCIGSTTYEEMRNHLEKDKAFSRRFQKIDIAEPSFAECLAILQGLKGRYEEHHGVRYTPEALEAAITLSVRYLPEARLPDKAIDLLDDAGAGRRLAPIPKAAAPQAREVLLVDVPEVERVVEGIARIPSVRASSEDAASLRRLEKTLRQAVFGQDAAVKCVTRAVLRSRAGFHREGRPQGAFLFYGPTGVGKTELAKQLAASLRVAFLRYDMSEYMEKHAVSRLIGAPPGYVGFDQGGLLTEAVRKTPHAVLLLDEMEKAHPDIFNVLLQVMDYATLTDTTGRKADFRNIILIMTTNAGAFEMSSRSIGFAVSPAGDRQVSAEKGRKALERLFTPEFRNRLDALVPFASLSPKVMGHIVEKFIAEIAAGLEEKKVTLVLTPAARSALARAGYDPAFGARPLARVLCEQVEDPLAGEILFGKLAKGGRVTIAAAGKADGDGKAGLTFHYSPAASRKKNQK
ncbi:MAG: AAA family ATPase [Desulfovibrio sp.]|jgi:ATP-dependent Clp protease ATP-binding subunit ClpA|nr:AAA family ATPase [Desulfovibrio sp.]